MNITRLRSIFTAFAFALASAAAGASHLDWQEITATSPGVFNIPGEGTVSIVPPSDSPMLFLAQNITQSPASIEAEIEHELGISSTLLVQATQCENTSCPGVSLVGDVFTVTGTTPFHIAAIHIGGAELLFRWTDSITGFVLTGLDNVSNFRAYSVIPLPGAFALFLGAMAFFGMLRRRFGLARPAAVPAIA